MTSIGHQNDIKEFCKRNLEKLLRKYSSGFVYFMPPAKTFEYYPTRELLEEAHPGVFESRYGNTPLIIDIVERQFDGKESSSKPVR